MKTFFYSLVLSCVIFTSQAQEDTYGLPQTSFGLKAGLNSIYVKTVSETQDFVQKNIGFYVGAFVNIPTSDVFSIQPEINYVSGEYTTNDNISLLHIPILLKLEVGKGFSGFIGPEGIVLLSFDDPNKDDFNSFMFGFTFGAAYSFSEHLSVEARPYFSISKFLDDGPGSFRRYNSLQFGLAYKF